MISLTVPVYYTQQFKTKPDKTFLVSLNWYRNATYFEQNKVKQHFSELISNMLTPFDKLEGQYSATYTYFYKNPTSDLPNVGPMVSKWVNDVLQELDIVSNDNVQFLTEEIYRVGGCDKLNPRVEVTLTPLHPQEP